MARQKSDKDPHQLEIEIVTLNERLKAFKVIGTSITAILAMCLSAFFAITQHNLSTKVDEAIKQTALKKATELAKKYANQAGVSAGKAKKYENDALESVNKINGSYEPTLNKLTELNKHIDFDDTAIRVSILKLGNKWSLSGVGEKLGGDDQYLRLLNPTGTAYYGGFAAQLLWCQRGQVEGSDITYKKDIEILDNSLEKIKLLRGVRFRWIDSENENDFRIGLIAQEVEKVFPEVVSNGPDGKKGINYSALIAPLVNAIQEQSRLIKKQNEKIASLERRLSQR